MLPLLFNFFLSRAVNEVAEMNAGMSIGRKINLLASADDIVLITKTKRS